jgi:hypothetical protein
MLNVESLASHLGLGSLLSALPSSYALVDHWTQGEFHHDVLLRLDDCVLVVATNCNGGVKEILAFDDVPDRWALWASRCPANTDFSQRAQKPLPTMLARATTPHYFDPCELLVDDARSELKPSCRKRAVGGGWEES